jgi:hypothetical protein
MANLTATTVTKQLWPGKTGTQVRQTTTMLLEQKLKAAYHATTLKNLLLLTA